LLKDGGPTATRRRSTGFTLAELAVGLVIIGLVLASVLGARAMLIQADIRRVAGDFEALRAAVHVYADRYGALPGDDPLAAGRWATVNGTGDRRLSGAYDAAPPASGALVVDASGGESLGFWWHLRLAGLVTPAGASASPATQPMNPFGGILGVEWEPLGLRGAAACTSDLPGDAAIGIESALDDGDPVRGNVRVRRAAPGTRATAAAQALTAGIGTDAAERFIVCRRLE
jgi:type II secretory pathway pseudopilin PulG